GGHRTRAPARARKARGGGQGRARAVNATPAGPLVRRLTAFGRVLREAGGEVGPRRLQDALLALETVDLRSRDEAYWALRCTLVSHQKDIETFDAAFAAFWERDPAATGDDDPPPFPGEPSATDERDPFGMSKEVQPRERVVASAGEDDEGGDGQSSA